MTTAVRPSLWRNRSFAALWGGQAASALGASISGTAFPLLVLATTGSPADAGLVGAAGTLPFLVANLPAGPLVDRWNRRRIMLVSEVAAGAALATVPIALALGAVTIAHLVVVAFVQGLGFVFFGLAERAALPLIVPAALLPTALAQNEARSRAAAMAGPPLGGLLFAAGRAVPFLFDAVSYLIASLALLLVRRDLQTELTGPPEPMWRAAATGLRFIWRHPLIRTAMLLIAVSNLVFQALILVLVVLARHRGATSTGIGVMLGIYSVGGLLGALAAGRLHRHVTLPGVVIGVNWIWAALLPLFTLADNAPQIGLIGAACAFIGPLWNVVILSHASVLVPNELLGRVMSAAMTMSWGVMPVASLAAGYLLGAVGPIHAIHALTALMLTAAIAATVSPAVRKAPPLPTPT